MNFMRKILFVLFAATALVWSGCQHNPPASGGGAKDEAGETVLESARDGIQSYKIMLVKDSKDGIASTTLRYLFRNPSTGYENIGFSVIKYDAGKDKSIYKAALFITRKNKPFSDEFFDRYEILAGAKNIYLNSAIQQSGKETDGSDIFLVGGGLSEDSLQAIKEANYLTTSLLHSEHPERKVTILLPEKFPLYVLKYF